MKKQIIAGMVLAVLATTGAYTYATNNSTGSVTKNEIMDIVKKARDGVTLTTDEQAKLDAVKSRKHSKTGSGETMFTSDKHKGFGIKGGKDNFPMMSEGFHKMTELTSEEKTKLESMSKDEKKAFFEAKMTENKAKAEAKETVIDKLLAGTALNADEEVVRAEIIKERAKMKAKKAEMAAKMTEIKTIMEKKKSGIGLTPEEKTKLDDMKKEHKKEGKGMEGMMR